MTMAEAALPLADVRTMVAVDVRIAQLSSDSQLMLLWTLEVIPKEGPGPLSKFCRKFVRSVAISTTLTITAKLQRGLI